MAIFFRHYYWCMCCYNTWHYNNSHTNNLFVLHLLVSSLVYFSHTVHAILEFWFVEGNMATAILDQVFPWLRRTLFVACGLIVFTLYQCNSGQWLVASCAVWWSGYFRRLECLVLSILSFVSVNNSRVSVPCLTSANMLRIRIPGVVPKGMVELLPHLLWLVVCVLPTSRLLMV